MNRRLMLVPLALLLTAQTGCASGRSSSGGAWMAGMMGVMVVGGLVVGRGWMHGGRDAMYQAPEPFADRYAPGRLLDQRALLELDDEQVVALEALRDDVTAERRTPDDAAREAFEMLRPVQRAAVPARSPAARQHH